MHQLGRPMIRLALSRDASLLLKSQASCRDRFSTSSTRQRQNRVFDSIRTPPAFHDTLRTVSSNNTLLLGLFTTSACAPCRTITPLLTEIVQTRAPKLEDKFSALALAEIELDSPDTSNGNMMDLGVQWGITSLPTLIGYGGRRADRVTDRIVDTKMMSDAKRMEVWVDEVMSKGDPSPTEGTGKGFFAWLFGG